MFNNLKLLLRRLIYLSLFILDTYLLNKKPGIFILCYHSMANDNWRYSTDIEEFKNQIKYLLSKGYTNISLQDIEMFIGDKKKLPEPSFVITFDDGYKDLLQLRSFLKSLAIKPTVFVLSDRKQSNRKELETNREFLSKDDILSLKKDGWIIGSHSATHSDFYTLTDNQIVQEVKQSKTDLEKQLGFSIDYFAYPKGRYTSNVLEAVRNSGYKLGLSINNGYVTGDTNRLLVPRIGIDRTYTFLEFKSLLLPSAVALRSAIGKQII